MIKSKLLFQFIVGKLNAGKCRGISPKVLPRVATPSKWKNACNIVTTTNATKGPGIRFKNLGVITTNNKLKIAKIIVVKLRCGNDLKSSNSFCGKLALKDK